MLRQPSNGFIAGLIVGSLLITLMTATGFPTKKSEEKTGHSEMVGDLGSPNEEAADAFVEAWAKMRNGTWAVDSRFTRTTEDGRTFQADVREAQRPPQRSRIASGSIEIRTKGRLYLCAVKEGARSTCQDRGLAPDFKAETERDLQAVRAAVSGPQRSYAVAVQGASCFQITKLPDARASEVWGTKARACFDPATGAQTEIEVHKADSTDVVRAIKVTTPSSSEFDVSGIDASSAM